MNKLIKSFLISTLVSLVLAIVLTWQFSSGYAIATIVVNILSLIAILWVMQSNVKPATTNAMTDIGIALSTQTAQIRYRAGKPDTYKLDAEIYALRENRSVINKTIALLGIFNFAVGTIAFGILVYTLIWEGYRNFLFEIWENETGLDQWVKFGLMLLAGAFLVSWTIYRISTWCFNYLIAKKNRINVPENTVFVIGGINTNRPVGYWERGLDAPWRLTSGDFIHLPSETFKVLDKVATSNQKLPVEEILKKTYELHDGGVITVTLAPEYIPYPGYEADYNQDKQLNREARLLTEIDLAITVTCLCYTMGELFEERSIHHRMHSNAADTPDDVLAKINAKVLRIVDAAIERNLEKDSLLAPAGKFVFLQISNIDRSETLKKASEAEEAARLKAVAVQTYIKGLQETGVLSKEDISRLAKSEYGGFEEIEFSGTKSGDVKPIVSVTKKK